MSFLTPLFLLGGLAIAAPVIYHLIRHVTRQKVQFSSLIFLEPSPPQITRKSRLQDILLLIFRCLVIAALALAFARPYMQKSLALPTTKGATKRIIALVDTSASMRRADLWPKAVKETQQIIAKANPGDEIALITFDRTATTRLRFEDSRAMPPGERESRVQQLLSSIQPSWNSTHFGTAIAIALEMLHEAAIGNADAEQHVYLVTDQQEGARLDGLQGLEWPKNTRVILNQIETTASNASLGLVAQPSANNAALKVRVSNSADSKKEQFKLGWATPGSISFLGASIDVYVPPGKSQTATAPERPKTDAPLALMISGDDHIFDNQIFVAASAQQAVPIVYFGADQPNDTTQPRYYLERALDQDPRQKITVSAVTNTVTPAQLEAAGLIVIANELSSENAPRVASALAAGKTGLVMLRSANMAGSIAAIAPESKLFIQEGPAGDGMLGYVNFEHPLFAPFSDPRFSDFTKIRFWKRRAINLESGSTARVLARFEDNAPAILHVPVGQGSMFVIASGWQPTESQLALSSKFVPLLYGMLDYAGAIRSGALEVKVGEALPLPKGRTELRIRPPAGEAKIIPGDAPWSETTQPGIYVLEGNPPQQFAVNLDPAETRTKPRNLEEFDKLGVPIKEQAPAVAPATVQSEKNLLAIELENRQKLWRWFLIAAVAALLLESALAAWKNWRRANQTETGALA